MSVLTICCVDGCQNQAGLSGSARGLCRAHYRRWQRYGDVNAPIKKVRTWGNEKCCEIDCDNLAKIHGLCEKHYAAIRRRNDPEKQKLRNMAFAERHRKSQEIKMGRPRPEVCELCGGMPNSRGSGRNNARICFDHDHVTGNPRGWLCDRCNKVLGMVKDSPELLRTLARYLEFHKYGKTHDKAA